MAHKILQILVLPVLFALLGAGGKTTFCEVLSVVGVAVHHHTQHGEDVGGHPGPFCLDSHEETGCDHGHETVPCPESCEIRLSEALAPGFTKLPALAETVMSASILVLPDPVESVFSALAAIGSPDPPDESSPLSAPSFTGRFLI